MSLAWAASSAGVGEGCSWTDVATPVALTAPRSAAVHRARYPASEGAQKGGRSPVGEGREREAPSREEACRPGATRPKRRPGVRCMETFLDTGRLGRVNQVRVGPSPPRPGEEMTGAQTSRPWEATARQASEQRTATQARQLSTATLTTTERAPYDVHPAVKRPSSTSAGSTAGSSAGEVDRNVRRASLSFCSRLQAQGSLQSCRLCGYPQRLGPLPLRCRGLAPRAALRFLWLRQCLCPHLHQRPRGHHHLFILRRRSQSRRSRRRRPRQLRLPRLWRRRYRRRRSLPLQLLRLL